MNEYQNIGLGGQLAPQGFFGGLIGAPLGGLIGRGIGGLFGNANLGHQIGQYAGGIGGAISPFGADPVAAAYAQQAQQQQLQQQLQQQQLQQLQQAQLAQQLAPQGWFGNLIGSVAQPLGGVVGGLFGHQNAGSTIGNVVGGLGRLLPFGADPVQAQQQYAQQVQQLQQQLQQQQQQYAQLVQALQQAQMQAQQPQQQGQIAPQGWFGNILGQVGQPLGQMIGSTFGNANLGNTIGTYAGQLGRMLPFAADPVAAAYAQQAQLGQANGYYPIQQGSPYAAQQTLH
jgi:hypothetical protein